MARRRAHGGRGEAEFRRGARSVLGRWAYYLGGGMTFADIRAHGAAAIGAIIERFRSAAGAEPAARMCWRWAYRADWIDPATGERVASVRVEAETDRLEQRQLAYYRARRDAQRIGVDNSGPTESLRAASTLTLHRIGRPIHVPCA